jgi:hypothetical protein
MVTTKVTWQYTNATQEEKDQNLAYEQTLAVSTSGDESTTRTSLHGELKEKSTEIAGGVNSATVEIERDEAAELIRHHWTRTWPDLAAAEQWIAFVLAKGALSAVVVEE